MITVTRSKSEVAAQVQRLRELRLLVRPMTFFNESNIEAIDAQIALLHGLRTSSALDRDEADDCRLLGILLDTEAWIEGDSAVETPSEGWESLKIPGGNELKLVSSDEAPVARCQHKTPCGDCPWRPTALKGWLGSLSPDEWLQAARSESRIDCHTQLGAQCAGAAIFRANIAKRPANPKLLVLKPDREKVFPDPGAFLRHHTR